MTTDTCINRTAPVPGMAAQFLGTTILTFRVAAAIGRRWRRYPVTARTLATALWTAPAGLRFRNFESAMVLTRKQVDTFLESGWDYTEPRLELLFKATGLFPGASTARKIIDMRKRMELSREGSFDRVVQVVYRHPGYPAFQHLGQAFRNYITERHPFMIRALKTLPTPPRRVCDTGCGAGLMLGDVLNECRGATGLGLDVSGQMVNHARRVLRAWGLGNRCQLVVADLRRIPVPDETFDFLVATEVLEHLPEPPTGVAEIARVVRPGGLLVTSVPVCDSAPTHLFTFQTADEVVALHRAAGLEIRDMRVNEVSPGVPNVLIAARRPPGPT